MHMHQRKHTPNKEEMVAINNNGSGGGRKMKQHLFSTKKTMPMIVIIVIVIIIIIMTVVITNQTPQGKKRLEFVHITKTAGSSIEKAATLQGINWGACAFYYINYHYSDYTCIYFCFKFE